MRSEGLMRKVININNAWKFIKQDEVQAMNKAYNDESWKVINLPHTWNAIDGANGNDFYKGSCWYRKEFEVDALSNGKKVFVEFEGSNSITDVYVNGKYLGQHRGGYSTFRFDITEVVEYESRNILTVKVDNTVVDDVYPQMADFTFYGGIYRDVNIILTNDVHFDLMDYGSKGIYMVQEEVSKERASLTIKSRLVNENKEDKKVRLWADICDVEGRNVTYAAKEVIIPAGETKEIEMPVVIESPTLLYMKQKFL
jgi:beta-galactosidase